MSKSARELIRSGNSSATLLSGAMSPGAASSKQGKKVPVIETLPDDDDVELVSVDWKTNKVSTGVLPPTTTGGSDLFVENPIFK